MAIYVENGLTMLINGRPLKSISHYWRKKVAEYQSTLSKYGLETSRRLGRMYSKWRRQIRHYIDARVREPWNGFMTPASPQSRSAIRSISRRRMETLIIIVSGHTDTC
jgi:hypothetical protein